MYLRVSLLVHNMSHLIPLVRKILNQFCVESIFDKREKEA